MNLSPSEVAQQLRDDTLPKRERLHYLVFYLFAPVLGDVWALCSGTAFPDPDPVSGLIQTAVLGAGILLCYQANERGDGRNFIDRLFCLSLPVGIWLMVACLISLMLVDLLLPDGRVKVLINEAWPVVWTVAFCLRVRHYFGLIAQRGSTA